MKDKVIVIVGPTAVGKTELSLKLARDLDGEIISGDSMQVYKGLDIGTAKATKEEQNKIPHHLIDIIDVTENFTVSDFQNKARAVIKDITTRGKLPIVVGGSGLYIQSVLYDYQFPTEVRSERLTKQLEDEVKTHGIDPLYKKLVDIDPDQASKIHPNNHRRVIRAIEVYKTTGLTMTQIQKKQKITPLYDAKIIGLEKERSKLYEQINKRVDLMLETGLLTEVEKLYYQVDESSQSMSGIGYKEFIPYFKNEKSLEKCIDILKRNSRRFAKRQYTWFKNKMDIAWYDLSTSNEMDLYDTIKKELTLWTNNKGVEWMSKLINIQDQYLNTLRKEKIALTVFLTNGFQLRGQIKSFDNFTVLLDSDGKEQLIYKHAISTFVPVKNVNLKE